jgi:hypothetical protein
MKSRINDGLPPKLLVAQNHINAQTQWVMQQEAHKHRLIQGQMEGIRGYDIINTTLHLFTKQQLSAWHIML